MPRLWRKTPSDAVAPRWMGAPRVMRVMVVSLRKRKLIETTFGWAKQYGGLRRMMNRGLDRVSARVIFTMTEFSLLRISHLVLEPAG